MPPRARRRLVLVGLLAAVLVISGWPPVEAQDDEIVPIGAVQGHVPDDVDGTEHTSPLDGDTVTVQGVIYQKTLTASEQNGFFLQNTAGTADADPLTSDGIFVFMGAFDDLVGDYVPQVGDEIVLRGRVSEFFNLTQLSSASALEVVRTGVDLDAELGAFEADPPDHLGDAERYWERREGMRAQVAAGSVVLNGRDVFGGSDAEVWVMRGDHPLAQRRNPYARRSFRDPHPLDNIRDRLFDDGNGYRIMMGSLGVKAALDDPAAFIAPARTFDTLRNAPVGGVYFTFGKYSVMVGEQLSLDRGVDPAQNAPPQRFNRRVAYSAVTLNVENLYDFRDDPFDGCDFAGNEGCPGVDPPFDYVPASDEVYQRRLGELAGEIAVDLHGPDLLLAQEAEDQDICTVEDGAFRCGAVDDADGKPDTLQELAVRIADEHGIRYDAAYDRDGADDRGIVSGFLFRTDRVELLAAEDDHPVFGTDPEVDYRSEPLGYNADVSNPKTLNAVLPDDVDRSTGTDGDNVFTRPPQVGLFRIWRARLGRSVFHDVYAISNHFSSGPDARVGQRTEQAAYNAAIVDALRDAGLGRRVIVGGDLNVFPRPDDPFPPGHPLHPSDQLGPLYEAGLRNLYDPLVAARPASAYTYVFQGQAQTLDQLFVTPALRRELEDVAVAHVNADFPRGFPDDGPRGATDHDPFWTSLSVEVSFGSLGALIDFYAAAGDVDALAERRLERRLARAERLAERGRTRAAQVQLFRFGVETAALTPRHITPPASQALIGGASRLFFALEG